MCKHAGAARTQYRLYDPAPVLELVSHLSIAQAANWLGTSPRQIVRWRTGQRWMQYNVADRVAIALNTTPQALWPDFGEACCEVTRREHGYSMYVHDRCECDVCMEAMRRYHRSYRARRRAARQATGNMGRTAA